MSIFLVERTIRQVKQGNTTTQCHYILKLGHHVSLLPYPLSAGDLNDSTLNPKNNVFTNSIISQFMLIMA